MHLTFLEKNTPFPTENFPKGAILLVDKPLSWTSFDVVNKIRWHLLRRLKIKKLKVGHAGTLDPLATGLLVICLGEYTKKIESFQDMPKKYTGTITFGATTPSFDLEKAPDVFFPTDHLTDALLEQVRPRFEGTVFQVPPMFSAIKVDGKRMYKNARTGEMLEMEPRAVTINSLKISNLRSVPTTDSGRGLQQINQKGSPIFLHPDFAEGRQIDFEVQCGKGTYIRSLANDLGATAGSGAYLSRLRRTETGGFSVENAWQVDEIVDWITG